MRDIGIIDGQNLNGTLACLGSPIDHHSQVTEITHAKTTLTAQ